VFIGLIQTFLERNKSKKLSIHCVGDALIDEYWQVRVNRISPEFPMPIMHSDANCPSHRPGGVANVAYQLKHFNVNPKLLCLSDPSGEWLFKQHGLSTERDEFYDARLPIKKRFLDGNVQIIRHDVEKPLCGLLIDELEDCLKRLQDKITKQPDVAILSDYNKGFFGSKINLLDSYRNCTTIVDPKKGPLEKWKGCTIFKPNSKEAEELSGKKGWKDQARFFKDELNCQSVVITHGGGVVAGIDGDEYFSFVPDKEVVAESVIGAGDCFCAFFAMAIGQGFTVLEASEIAWNAGAIYVQRKMNKPVCPSELQSGLVDPEILINRNYKLVFCNGCFDVLHTGHMELLKFAKSKGDKLVVALNSDASVKRLKGEQRPIVPLEQRMAVMSHIKYVDFVVSFDEDTPSEVIDLIKPDVLVKGGEYKIEDIIGADKVKEVYRAPMVPDVSTTKILSNHLQPQL